MKTLNEEWPQKGAKGAKKESSYFAIIFEPFAPFCGQMPFFLNEKAVRVFRPEWRMTMRCRERVGNSSS
jgi:hypothetical protein